MGQGYAIHYAVGANRIWNWIGNMESSVMEFQAEGYKFKLLNIRKKSFIPFGIETLRLYRYWNSSSLIDI